MLRWVRLPDSVCRTALQKLVYAHVGLAAQLLPALNVQQLHMLTPT